MMPSARTTTTLFGRREGGANSTTGVLKMVPGTVEMRRVIVKPSNPQVL